MSYGRPIVSKLPHPLQKTIAYTLWPPSMLYNILTYRIHGRSWWTRVDDHVIIGAFPWPHLVEKAIQEEGIQVVVNLCAESEGPKETYARHNITMFQIPTIDYTTPTLEDLARGVDYILDNVRQGKQIYVHCKAGKGRSATLVTCYLMKRYHLDPESAFAKLLNSRDYVASGIPKAPSVIEYYERFVKNDFSPEAQTNLISSNLVNIESQ